MNFPQGLRGEPRNVLPVERRKVATRGRRYRTLASMGVELLEGRALMATSSLTNPALIETLAAEAYVWGLAPDYLQRFSTLNVLTTAPINTFHYSATPAAWNNSATNAGDASVLYNSAFIDFDKTSSLVLTVPPSNQHYYVGAYMDAYANTIGSIGTRTTPTDVATSYLLVGPNSPYAKEAYATIHGVQFRVLASDTNLNWLLVRESANPLLPASNPQSAASVYTNVALKFALNTLGQFEKNRNQPVYPVNPSFTPTKAELAVSQSFETTPMSAVRFLNQVGASVKNNPIPSAMGGLSGTLVTTLPSWVVPQASAGSVYISPSYGQQGVLSSFAPLGLTSKGYLIPRHWGKAQFQALQEGFEKGMTIVNQAINAKTATSSTNYWSVLNSIVGTYPSNEVGYVLRSAVVLEGGVANLALDGVYPTTSMAQGGTALDGNNTYSITFTPPTSTTTYPVSGIYPPEVTNSSGNAVGFWSITLYQPDPDNSSAPFFSQAGVLNTSYSQASSPVVSVDPTTDLLTVLAPASASLKLSTPILFGSNAASYGLKPNTVYYVASTPTASTTVDPLTQATIYSFKISQQWIQKLSEDNVPIQNTGNPGAFVALKQPPSGAGTLTYGVVNPVSQLGSQQLEAGQLALNSNGSLTLWFAPSLPANAPASNWIPTPSSAYFSAIYGSEPVSTALVVDIRMYYPTPGNMPPSILPYSNETTNFSQTYIPPIFVQVG